MQNTTGSPGQPSHSHRLTKNRVPSIRVHRYVNLSTWDLDPYAFRLLAHIAHRDECYASVDRMAMTCCMSDRQVQKCLRILQQRNLISCSSEKKHNKTFIYYLNLEIDTWSVTEPLTSQTYLELPAKSQEIVRQLSQDIRESYKVCLNHMQDIRIPKMKRQRLITVHAYLDLFYLNPYEFRILSYISSFPNQVCRDTVATIAFICKMSERKVYQSLQRLKEENIICKAPNQSRVQIQDLRLWNQQREIKKGSQEIISKIRIERQKLLTQMMARHEINHASINAQDLLN